MDKSLKRILIGVGVLTVLGMIGLAFIIRAVLASGIASGPDKVFGDQHLKTTVALIELHKLRYGEYPATLKDLKYTGQWDEIALHNVDYTPSPDRSAYFVEVRRGWIGRPDLEIPAEFWQGTGFRPGLNPKLRGDG